MGLRTAASTVSSDSDATKIMAPALTEPVSHQSKISSPAQASSPRPIISSDVDTTTSTTAIRRTTPQTTLNRHSNSIAISAAKKDTSFDDTKKTSGFQLAFVNHTVTSNGLSVTHMDLESDDQTASAAAAAIVTATNDSNQTLEEIVADANSASKSAAESIVDDVLANVSGEQANQLAESIAAAVVENVGESIETAAQLLQQTMQATASQPTDKQVADILQQEIYSSAVGDLQNPNGSMPAVAAGAAGAVGAATVAASTSSATTSANAAEIEQWSDLDLMQVLKSFESTPAGENLCDLAGSLSLFNDVDVMNIGLEEVGATNIASSPVKDAAATQELLDAVEAKRSKMTRECDFMMRRLRKIQARMMGRHVSSEIYGVFEYAQQMIKRKERESKSISTMTPIAQLQNDKHKQSAGSSMKTLLKRIDQAASIQQTGSGAMASTVLGNSGMAHAASDQNDPHWQSGTEPSGVHRGTKAFNEAQWHTTKHNGIQRMASVVPPFDQVGIQQMKQCTGLLGTELKLVNSALDSDATASSSGGESADEMVSYNNATQQPLSIARRAAYRWARDRAKIASRWSWLLAQISDLEYRIRQHHELHLLLKMSNGQVELEDTESSETTATATGTPTTAAFPTPTADCQQLSVNGYRGVLPGNLRSCDDGDVSMKTADDQETDATGTARTRPFKWNGFKKRKLLQSTNLHKISRRAARPCTIKCGCRWPVHPCLVCTGRHDPTAIRDLPDMMSTQEGVALLDPCFHPILSFPEDVAQSIHIEGTLRQTEWQTKAVRATSKALIKGAQALQKASERDERARKTSDIQMKSKKLTSKKYNNSNSNYVGTKLKRAKKNNNTDRSLKKQYMNLIKSKKKPRKNSLLSLAGSDIGGHHHENTIGSVSSPNGSLSRSMNPSPTPGSSHTKYERMHSEKRNNKNQYDIDNIVIPYNIAASHRVEVLSYKEIPTPKWRLIDEKSEISASNENQTRPELNIVADMDCSMKDTTINEDISVEAFQQRHERALADERKKFSTFLKFPYSTRSRANRRTDSQADSSGANTPDPMSPAPSTPATSAQADQESAPPTPQSVDATDNTNDAVIFPQPASLNINNNTIANLPQTTKTERRRTVSFRKGADPREELLRRSNTPDIKESIPPFEPLEFPLANDTVEQMIQCMPSSYKKIIDNCISLVTDDPTHHDGQAPGQTKGASTKIGDNCSHLSILEDSDETESALDEDPNDPEWREPPPRIPRTEPKI